MACLLLLALAAAAQQREPVLPQIDVPHSYYYREMYLPQLTSGPSSVAWLPDGKAVVFSMQGYLWRQALDATVAEQLTSGHGYHYQPDVSPDGRWVVFANYLQDALELYACEIATGRTVQLTRDGAVNLEPRFSPDGARLAYVSTAGTKRFHIFVAEFRDGTLTQARRLTGETFSNLPRYYYSRIDHEISPSWSPDGREILFVTNSGHLYGTGGLRRMLAVPGADMRLIHHEETTWRAKPDWSPDGSRVVFSSYQGRQWHQLWLVPAEAGGHAFPISYGEYDNTAPRWSGDGSRIAFISNRGGSTSLWIQDAVGGAQRELAVRSRKYRDSMTTLRVRVLAASGQPTAARVAVTCGGRAYAPDDAWVHADDGFVRSERASEAAYFHTAGTAELRVPAGACGVEVMKGFAHAVERRTVTVPPTGLQATVQLKSLAEPTAVWLPWVSGDVHVHMNYGGAYRNTPENLVRQAEAEDLQVVHSLIVNKEQRIPDIAYFTGKPDAASTARTVLWHGQEFHTSGWGHMGLLGLQNNILLPDYADYPRTGAASLYPSNDVIADLARAQGGLVGYVHPYEIPAPDPVRDPRLIHTLPLNVALGKVDYLEVMGFSDHHVTAEVWYRLLNLGFRIPAAGGTDAMANFASLHGPVGMNRTYVRLTAPPARDPAQRMQQWLAGLQAGRTFATNGPLLAFSILGNLRPGDELKISAGKHAINPTFRALVRSIVPLEHAQVVCNGKVVQEIALAADKKSAEGSGTLTLQGSGWCLLRAWHSLPQHPVLDIYPYATTSPIYITADGAVPHSPTDAAYFVAWLDRIGQAAEAFRDWNNDGERLHVLGRIATARAEFAKKARDGHP
jgi:Tol biopolymer transport system component